MLFAFTVTFFPPSQLPVGSPALYTGLVVAGTVVFLAIRSSSASQWAAGRGKTGSRRNKKFRKRFPDSRSPFRRIAAGRGNRHSGQAGKVRTGRAANGGFAPLAYPLLASPASWTIRIYCTKNTSPRLYKKRNDLAFH